jgi:hypothetical protein
MSATRKKTSPTIPDVRKAAKKNPQVDVKQVEEAQSLLEELRKTGRGHREYGLGSPYARKPLRRGRSGFGTSYG